MTVLKLPDAIGEIERVHPHLAAPVVHELRRARRQAARYRAQLRVAWAEVARMRNESGGDAA